MVERGLDAEEEGSLVRDVFHGVDEDAIVPALSGPTTL